MLRDTVVSLSGLPKLVIYLGGNDCAPCSLRELRHWKPALEQIGSMEDKGAGIDVIFILKANKNNPKIKETLLGLKFPYPILFDSKGEFERANLLPFNSMMHTFMLDKNRKVVLVGNPLVGQNSRQQFKIAIRSLNTK